MDTAEMQMEALYLNELPDPKKKPESGLEPSPCELFNCPMYERCKNEALSCKGFTEYLSNGETTEDRIGEPTREIYLHQFDEETDEYI